MSVGLSWLSGCCSGFMRASLQRGQNTPRGRTKNLVRLRPVLLGSVRVLLQLHSLRSSKKEGQLVPASLHISKLDVKNIFIGYWKSAVGAFTVLKNPTRMMCAIWCWGWGAPSGEVESIILECWDWVPLQKQIHSSQQFRENCDCELRELDVP